MSPCGDDSLPHPWKTTFFTTPVNRGSVDLNPHNKYYETPLFTVLSWSRSHNVFPWQRNQNHFAFV